MEITSAVNVLKVTVKDEGRDLSPEAAAQAAVGGDLTGSGFVLLDWQRHNYDEVTVELEVPAVEYEPTL